MATPTNNQVESIKWTKVEVDAFVNAMVDEVKKGNKTTSTFNKAGWNSIKSKLESQFGRPFTNLQLRNKMNKLRNDYSSFKKLLETSGFNWNVDIRACEVTDESVWDRHIKENPTWMRFKRNGLPQWPELQIIFGDSYASGAGAVGNAEEHHVLEGMLDSMEEHDFTQPSPGVGNSENEQLNEGTGTHQLDRTPSGKRKKGRSADLVGAIREMCEVSRAKLEIMNNTIESKSTVQGGNDYSVNSCMKLLDKMEGVNKDLYMDAVMKMIENPTWREAFMSFPEDKRIWLLERLE